MHLGIYFALDKSLSIAALVQRSFPVGEVILFSESMSATLPRLAPERIVVKNHADDFRFLLANDKYIVCHLITITLISGSST